LISFAIEFFTPACGKAIDSLAESARPEGRVKLAAEESLYRIRVGEYRIIYEVKDKQLVVLVIKIGHRREFIAES
jgi:mRNA interferase RelE/StbE